MKSILGGFHFPSDGTSRGFSTVFKTTRDTVPCGKQMETPVLETASPVMAAVCSSSSVPMPVPYIRPVMVDVAVQSTGESNVAVRRTSAVRLRRQAHFKDTVLPVTRYRIIF
jgi:hypothetical protein